MNQNSFNFPLSEFEQATIVQLVSYKIGKKPGESDESVDLRIAKKMNSQKFIDEVIGSCARWNNKRIDLGLKPWT